MSACGWRRSRPRRCSHRLSHGGVGDFDVFHRDRSRQQAGIDFEPDHQPNTRDQDKRDRYERGQRCPIGAPDFVQPGVDRPQLGLEPDVHRLGLAVDLIGEDGAGGLGFISRDQTGGLIRQRSTELVHCVQASIVGLERNLHRFFLVFITQRVTTIVRLDYRLEVFLSCEIVWSATMSGGFDVTCGVLAVVE